MSLPHQQNNPEGVEKQPVIEAALRANTVATITAIGHPDVVPPVIVGVSGVGNELGGNYWVRKATHILNTSGYEMTLEVVRTSTGPGTGDGTVAKLLPYPSSSGGESISNQAIPVDKEKG